MNSHRLQFELGSYDVLLLYVGIERVSIWRYPTSILEVLPKDRIEFGFIVSLIRPYLL